MLTLCGVQFVMMAGMTKMPWWFVDNWDIQEMVHAHVNIDWPGVAFLSPLLCPGSMPYSLAHFGEGTGPIVLDDVQCNPSIHRRLLDCPHPGLRQHNCRHFEDAGVSCSPCMSLKHKLCSEVLYHFSCRNLYNYVPFFKFYLELQYSHVSTVMSGW